MQKKYRPIASSVILMLLISFYCSKYVDDDDVVIQFFEANYEMNSLGVDTSLFYPYIGLGVLTNAQIDEASGIAVSRHDSTFIWTHNDSGDLNRIFLFKNDGTYAGAFRIDGAGNRDWEDMAIGPGPVDGMNYLYVADIGDNIVQYSQKHIYRFPEPNIALADTTVQWVNYGDNVDRITFQYPSDIKMDAEALMIDPWTKDLYIVTKREFPVVVYRLPFPQSTTETIVAQKYGTLPFTLATAGDISADGKEILIKTKEKVFLWTRNEGESIADALIRQPIRVTYTPEPQGEAIAYTGNGCGYYTLSEAKGGIIPTIYYYKRK
jgi:hypothetical protein